MAVVTVKATAISNRDASPKVLSNDRISKSSVMCAVGTAAVANGDSAASKYLLGSIPSNARISDFLFSCGALGGSAAGTIGLFQTTANGGLQAGAAGANFFSAGQTLVSALSRTSLMAAITIDKIEQPVWQILGLTTDPKCDFDIAVVLTAASAAAVNVAMSVEYVV